MRPAIFLLFLLTACNLPNQKSRQEGTTKADTEEVVTPQLSLLDTVARLLTERELTDTFEYRAWAYSDTAPYPFIYFKAGKLFDKKNKVSHSTIQPE